LLFERWRLDRVRQERATAVGSFGSMPVGEESELTNAMEAVGQGVEHEAPDELVGLQPHGLDGAAAAIVLPGKSDMIVLAGLDAAVGDGDAMGVAAEIGEDLRGPAERPLATDVPPLY
jgi:hypothetical protein